VNNRVLKVLALFVALSVALGAAAIVGGSVVYALTHLNMFPVAKAQAVDPGYGIVIASVEPDSPAAAAGVVRGDILLEMDGEALENPGDWVRCLGDLEPGDQVELRVLHGDEDRTLTATLGERHGRAYLGVAPCAGFPEAISVHVGGPGALIIQVMPDSPADEAGLREGHVIVAVDGRELDDEGDLADLIAEYQPGDMVALEIERPGEEPYEVTVELGEHPEKEDVAHLGVRYVPFPHIEGLPEGIVPFDEFEFEGWPFVLPHDEWRFDLPEGEIQQGVIVRRVYDDSPASAAGLKEGDVITAIDGEPVESPRALTDAIAEREPGDQITLTVDPSGEEEREVQVLLGEHPDKEGKAYLGVSIGGFFRMHRFEGDEHPRMFRFSIPPFDFDELPSDELPFDLDEFLRQFRFPWKPDEDIPIESQVLPGEKT